MPNRSGGFLGHSDTHRRLTYIHDGGVLHLDLDLDNPDLDLPLYNHHTGSSKYTCTLQQAPEVGPC